MRRSHLQRLPSFRKCTGTNAAGGWDGFWNQSHMKVFANLYSSDVENVKQKCDYFQFKLNFSIVGAFFQSNRARMCCFPSSPVLYKNKTTRTFEHR